MKVLITGITGFAGSHLVDYLLDAPGVEIHGIQRWRSRTENVDHVVDKISMYECDMRDAHSVTNVIKEVQPDRIFHLAAQSLVPASWKSPAETLGTNVLGQLNIFEAVRRVGISPRIQIAGSSEEYGLVLEEELPVRETNPLRPLSPYAVSKVSQDMMGYQYFKSFGMDIVRTRAFNHTGPRRPPVFVCSDFARQLVQVELGLKKPEIRVGNLDAKRDFTDVRDVVIGYWLALESGVGGEVYNICSGSCYKISDVLDMLIKITGVKVTVVHDRLRMRPSDVPVLQGDNSSFRSLTGWKPEIPFEKTLTDLVEFWRKALGKK
jgi:GDP-4-dehydro-6-deoxy-D-mannose reductase